MSTLRQAIKRILPPWAIMVSRALRSPGDLGACISFLFKRGPRAALWERVRLVRSIYVIGYHVTCYHTQKEALEVISAILSLPPDMPGVVVEAGCAKGGSSAKFSLAARLTGRELVVFDSFERIPENDEPHDKNIFGGPAGFKKGDYAGSIEEVKGNVAAFGEIGPCRFVKGWFDETLPGFDEPVAAAYLDVDLASSTRACLKRLYPLLVPGGVLFSQDGHLPLVLEVFRDEAFWRGEVGEAAPVVYGLGREKLIHVVKPG